MKLLSRINQWRQAQTGLDEELIDRDGSAWLVSVAVHFLLLLAVTLVPAAGDRDDFDWTLVVPESVEEELIEMEESPPVFSTLAEALPDIGAPSAGDFLEAPLPAISEIAPAMNLVSLASETAVVEPVPMVNFHSNEGATLLEHVAGARGAIVDGHGDAGSVDRITQEILTRLEESPVLVAWLMDASGSLGPRREQIIQRFDRVYDELGELAPGDRQPLLTALAAFGEQTTFLLPDPTSDRPAIQQAVREIAADESGVENVFAAVHAVAKKYASFTRQGRHLMIVIVTDEKGDDEAVLDEALTLVRQQHASAYVIGPLAPFGRDQLEVTWTDPKSGEKFRLPVARGPETLHVEHARLAIWKDGPGSEPLSSGFGPFGLMRLTQESGGLYLSQDNGDLGERVFNPERLGPYRPDYVPRERYLQLAADSPLRAAVVRVAEATNQRLSATPPTRFFAAGIQFEIRGIRDRVRTIADTLDRSLQELDAVQARRGKERSERWLAHYDLLSGRLLANRIRCASFGRLLEEMYRQPKQPEDGVNNAWEIVGDLSTALAAAAPEATATKSSEAQETTTPTEFSQLNEQADAARAILQRVVEEYPGTPWAAIAEQELAYPLAFQWQPTFMDPPEGVPLPWDKVPWDKLTEAQKIAKADFEARRERRQRAKAAEKSTETPRTLPPKL